ncbi:siderophore-interacting protein [Yaniella flava]|uniref:Siderophore-interacting protein n=1 Tax=Yaniella flava TaxID=287930 RepID=A0ABN2UQK6_9MICC
MSHASHGPVRGVVESVEDVSPTFRRIVFSGEELNHLAVEPPFYDQRIKLILPNVAGDLPQVAHASDWYQQWLALPDAQRGVMRTYSIRELTRVGNITRLTVDFVLHFADDGSTGPAAAWAAAADAGSELLVVAPRQGQQQTGIEFVPGEADEIVLLGDEAAAPAIARILEDLKVAGSSAKVCAYIEVPTEQDRLAIDVDDHADVHWLPRGDEQLGEPLAAALGWHVQEDEPVPAVESVDEDLLWETPVFSASGEDLGPAIEPRAGMYYWIAGESGVIKRLRRFLVREVGVDRAQVAFMGYWRLGVAMRG